MPSRKFNYIRTDCDNPKCKEILLVKAPEGTIIIACAACGDRMQNITVNPRGIVIFPE